MTHRVSVLVGVNQTAVFDKSDSHTYLKRLYIDLIGIDELCSTMLMKLNSTRCARVSDMNKVAVY